MAESNKNRRAHWNTRNRGIHVFGALVCPIRDKPFVSLLSRNNLGNESRVKLKLHMKDNAQLKAGRGVEMEMR